MSNGWTPERRLRQSQIIQQWKPWQSAGVKTDEGKNISKMNAYKHGARRAEVRNMSKQITNCKRILSQLIENKFSQSVVIRKELLKTHYADPSNPYHLALGFGLERIYSFLNEKQQTQRRTHIVFECRGKKEDKDLELEFRRVCDDANLPFDIILADKKSNSCGLQLADLIARPIGRYLLDPAQDNRAYSIIDKKIYCDERGRKEGWGIKCFP